MAVGLLVLLLQVSACFSAKSVADFSFVSWNADGGQHWSTIKDYFLKSAVDLMAIRRAAEVPHYPSPDTGSVFRAVPEGDLAPTHYLGACAAQPAFDVEQYLWNLTEHDQVYLYYYTDRRGTPTTALISDRLTSGTQNLAILSRHKASRLFQLPAVDAEGKLVDSFDSGSTSPLLGLRIESGLFFQLGSAEVNAVAPIVHQVTNVTQAYYPTLTWVLMGGFDQTPDNLAEALAQLPAPPENTFRKVVATGAATRVLRPWDEGQARGRRNRRKQKRRSNRRQRSLLQLQRLPQSDTVDEEQLPIVAVPLTKVKRKHRSHPQRVVFHRSSKKHRSHPRRNHIATASREVDYAIFGGPNYSRHIMKLVNVELLQNYFARVGITEYPRNPSHHLPLIFNKQL